MKDLLTIDVNGTKIQVEARARARYTEENRPNPLVKPGTELPTVDELLLSDGTVLYQCMHHADENCTFTHGNLRSVTAHQTAHGKRAIERSLRETTKRVAQAEQELAARKQRQVDGGRKAAATRIARQTASKIDDEELPTTPRHTSRMSNPVEVGVDMPTTRRTAAYTKSGIGDAELAEMGRRVITTYNAMQDAHDEFQKVLIGYLRAVQVKTDEPTIVQTPIPQEILDKAKAWDDMQAVYSRMNGSDKKK